MGFINNYPFKMKSDKKLSPSELMIDSVVHPVDLPENAGQDGLPYVTHEGLMKIGDTELRVYVLSDGQRVIDVEDADKFFNFI